MTTPVTILCGGLGAGKTTLLSHLLESDSDDRDIAVLVNDFGDVNVDADLVEARTDLAGEDVVALENGCICCSLGGDLARSVIDLWKQYDFDALVVEASGVGEPEPIARQFVQGPAAGPYDLSAVVTVVDARAFYDTFADNEPVRHGPTEDGTRPLADLLLEQVEFCNLLVVNKCDLVTDAERDQVLAILETLQPRADRITTTSGTVEPAAVLEAESFDLEDVAGAAGWKQAVEVAGEHGRGGTEAGDSAHAHEENHEHEHAHSHEHDDHGHSHHPDQYGLTVDTYHQTRPFHPERFCALLADLPDNLVRAKGLTWVAGRDRQALTSSYAGTETTIEVTGRWIASLPDDRQTPYRAGRSASYWDEQWGDREIRLALIGRDLDVETLTARLDDCLLTDAAMADYRTGDWTTDENSMPTGMGETVTVSTTTTVRLAE